MVKLRRPGTFAAAIARLMEAIGYEAVAAESETSKSELYRWSDEDCPKLPRLDQARRLDELALRHGLGTPILDVYRTKIEQTARPAHEPRDPLEAVTSLIHEVSEAASAYRAAHGRPSPMSITEGLREIADAREELDKLEADLSAMLPGAEPLRMVGPERMVGEARRG